MDNKQIEAFFGEYATDLTSGSGERIASNYDLPAFMIMAVDSPGRPVADLGELAKSFEAASALYREHGFGEPVVRVSRVESVTSSIDLAWVTWDYRDTEGRAIYEADYMYAVRNAKGGVVISSVYSINEQERLAAWLESREADKA